MTSTKASEMETSQVTCDTEEMRNIIDCLHDTFVKYLQPGVIIDNNEYFRNHKDEIVQDQSTRETVAQNLLAFVVEDDAAVQQFIEALRNLTCDSADNKNPSDSRHPCICMETHDEKLCIRYHMKNLVKAVDGSLFRKLSQDDTAFVLDVLCEEKVITERTNKLGKDIADPYKCCVKVLSSMKRGNPDGPLAFFTAISKRKPDLIQLSSQQETQMIPTGSIATSSGESPSASSIGTEHLSDDHIENSHDSPSRALENFSTFSCVQGSESSISYLSEGEKSKLPWSTESGTADGGRSTSNPDVGIGMNNSDPHSQSTIGGSSSSEEVSDDSDEADEVEHEEPPPLELRNYQKELAENALMGKNTIIYAPTGSGKTRVATHIIQHHLMENEQDGERKGKVAFLARTVPLVMQQHKSLKTYLPRKFQVTCLTGDNECSNQLHMIMEDNDVIVMTPAILENHLRCKYLKDLSVFSMLVFDECHHTRKGEPYNTLMSSYLKTKMNDKDKLIKLPQIVGLTASISVEKAVTVGQAVEYILQICGNLDVDNISCVVKNEEELLAKVPVPKELMVTLSERKNDEAVEKIKQIMSELESSAEQFGEDIKKKQLSALLKEKRSDKKSQQYGQWTVNIKKTAKAIRGTNTSVRCLIIIADYLAAYNVALGLHDFVQMREVMAYLGRCFDKYKRNPKPTDHEKSYYDQFEELQNLLKKSDEKNPNLRKLKKNLKKYLVQEGKTSRGIIFVRTRALTDAITSWLNGCEDEKLEELKATVLTGTGASVEQGGMTTVQQDEVIQKFKSGEVRLLVATSVGEEGLDIPECNLVIKYNCVGNEVATVQTRVWPEWIQKCGTEWQNDPAIWISKCRSRKEGGRSVLLAMEDICRKERFNQRKAEFMIGAIKEIRQMERCQIQKKNQKHQEKIVKEVEIDERIKHQESRLERKPFKMVCSRCQKVVIDSQDIKTISGTHRVVVNRKTLDQMKTIPSSDTQCFDEFQISGSVCCLGEPKEGKYCYNELGFKMVYKKTEFVVLRTEPFGFDTGSEHGLALYNKWKKVPYAVDEIDPEDFQRYMAVEQGVEESHDVDEDSDRNNDEDRDKNPPHDDDKDKEEPPRPQGQIPENDSLTELKRPQTDSSDGGSLENASSLTAPKRHNTVKDKSDSGFPQNSELSFTTSQPNALTLEGAVGGVQSLHADPRAPLKSGDERRMRGHERPLTQTDIDKELNSCLNGMLLLSANPSIAKPSVEYSEKASSLQISEDGSDSGPLLQSGEDGSKFRQFSA